MENNGEFLLWSLTGIERSPEGGIDVLVLKIKLSFLHAEASTRDASPETVGYPQRASAKGAC